MSLLETLCRFFDEGLAALVEDLEMRGLSDETLVVEDESIRQIIVLE